METEHIQWELFCSYYTIIVDGQNSHFFCLMFCWHDQQCVCIVHIFFFFLQWVKVEVEDNEASVIYPFIQLTFLHWVVFFPPSLHFKTDLQQIAFLASSSQVNFVNSAICSFWMDTCACVFKFALCRTKPGYSHQCMIYLKVHILI